MSRAQQYADSVSRLIEQEGAVRGQEAANKGQIWGGAIANIGDFAGNALQQYSANKQDKKLKDLFDTAATQYKAQTQPTPDGFVGPINPTLRQSPFPTLNELTHVVGPERAIKIADGMKGLQTVINPTATFEAKQKAVRDTMLGMTALGEPLRAEVYPGIRQHMIQAGVIQPQDAPEQYDASWWKTVTSYGQEPSKAQPTEASLAADLSSPDPAIQQRAQVALDRLKPVSTKPKTWAEMALDAQDTNSPTHEVSAAALAAHEKVAQPKTVTPGSFEDYIVKKYGLGATPDQIIQARTTYGRADDRAAGAPATVVVQTIDENGKPVTKIVPKVAGATYERPPSATTQTRLDSAQAVNQTGNDIIQRLSDPKYAATVGPIMGRYNSLREFIGNPPPELSELAGMIESYALANMGVHGMRSAQGAEQIKTLLDKKQTPQSLIAGIRGLQGFSTHFLENEGRKPAPAPSSSAPAGLSYQDYLRSKGQK